MPLLWVIQYGSRKWCQIGQAIAAEVLGNAGYEATVAVVDVSSRDTKQSLVELATSLGDVTGVIHAAGVSPSQASPSTILPEVRAPR